MLVVLALESSRSGGRLAQRCWLGGSRSGRTTQRCWFGSWIRQSSFTYPSGQLLVMEACGVPTRWLHVEVKLCCLGLLTVFLHINHRRYPYPMPVVRFGFQEPCNDPQNFCYLWVLHESKNKEQSALPFAVMYGILYKRVSTPYQAMDVTINSNEDPSKINLFVMVFETWECNSDINSCISIIVFDMNQWYKAQMPHQCYVGYSVPFINFMLLERVSEWKASVLDVHTIFLFDTKIVFLRVPPSAQKSKSILEKIVNDKPSGLINPSKYYTECKEAGLRPCFSDSYNNVIVPSQSWISGCILPNLIEWAWECITRIKHLTDTICIPLFDYSGDDLDRENYQKLKHCCQLIQIVRDRFIFIEKNFQALFDRRVALDKKLKQPIDALQLVTKYFAVIIWCLDGSLLPEKVFSSTDKCVPTYTINIMQYTEQKPRREELRKIAMFDKYFLIEYSIIYIIDFILENNHKGEKLRMQWEQESGGMSRGHYPPITLQSLLRMFLMPDLPVDIKHFEMIYFLLDVCDYRRDEDIKEQLFSFSVVFSIDVSYFLLVQACWYLDHEKFEEATDILLTDTVTVQLQNKPNLYKTILFICLLCDDLGLLKEIFKFPITPEEEKEFIYVEAVDVNHNLGLVVPKFGLVGHDTTKQNSDKGRITTKDLLVDAFSKTLPGVTNELIALCRKEKDKVYRFKEVKPTPLSVIVHTDMSQQIPTYKSSFETVLQAAISKTAETWTKFPKSTNKFNGMDSNIMTHRKNIINRSFDWVPWQPTIRCSRSGDSRSGGRLAQRCWLGGSRSGRTTQRCWFGSWIRQSSFTYPSGQLLVMEACGVPTRWLHVEVKLYINHRRYPYPMPVVRFGFQEPCNDPQNFCYLWVLHESKNKEQSALPFAVMYGILYKRVSTPYQAMDVTINSNEDPSKINLFVMVFETWECNSDINSCISIIVFDMNQWYKAQMPHQCYVGYSVPFINFMLLERVSEWKASVLDVHTIFLFDTKIVFLRVPPSAQKSKSILEKIVNDEPSGLINPSKYYTECKEAGLRPCFSDSYNNVIVPSQSWISGCILPNLIEWAWECITRIKHLTDTICIPLFDYSGDDLDRENYQKLKHCCQLIQIVRDRFIFIEKIFKHYLIDDKKLKQPIDALQLVTKYFAVIIWCLDGSLLPEKVFSSTDKCVPTYTINIMQYTEQKPRREELRKIAMFDKYFLIEYSIIYIIDFILENNHKGEKLRMQWEQESGGMSRGHYPPITLQSLLRMFLMPDLPVDIKHFEMIYFLLDVCDYRRDEDIKEQLFSFSVVFSIDVSYFLLVQACWYLDHEKFEEATDILLTDTVTVQLQNKPNLYKTILFICLLCDDLGLLKEIFKFPITPEEEKEFIYVEAVDVNHNLGLVVPKFGLVGHDTTKQNSDKGRITTKDLLVDAFSKTLPGVTNELIALCRKEKDKVYRFKEVKPTPLSVIVHTDMSQQIPTYKSSFETVLQAAISKTAETWTKFPKSTNKFNGMDSNIMTHRKNIINRSFDWVPWQPTIRCSRSGGRLAQRCWLGDSRSGGRLAQRCWLGGSRSGRTTQRCWFGSWIRQSSFTYPSGQLLVMEACGVPTRWLHVEVKLYINHRRYPYPMPVVRFGFQEPCNDPQNFCYLWVLHESKNKEQSALPFAVMYGILYKRVSTPYQAMDVTINSNEDPSKINLFVMVFETWECNSDINSCISIIVFDMNQWYKAQMPHQCYVGYSVPFINFMLLERVSEWKASVLDVHTIFLFDTKIVFLRVPPSAQKSKSILEKIVNDEPSGLINPSKYYTECKEAGLRPCFSDSYNNVIVPSQSWISGCILPNLIEWAWECITRIKHLTDTICIPLFDYSGDDLDRENYQKLKHCCQLIQIVRDRFIFIEKNFQALFDRRKRFIKLQPLTAVENNVSETFHEKNARLKRPLSPHLTIYKPPLAMIMSISHRIAGVALIVYVAVIAGGNILYSVEDVVTYIQSLQLSAQTLFITRTILAIPISYHIANGFRHLIWDAGLGLSIKSLYLSGYTVLGLTILMSISMANI
ncbi:hypothetical protein PGB90_003430 [Kerria lacca]